MTIPENVLFALIGGGMIGLSAVLLMFFLGRIMGVSGIAAQSLTLSPQPWAIGFLIGLILVSYGIFYLDVSIPKAPSSSSSMIAIAGLIVGFGTRLGSGCTSGHGVCGISRLSSRSIWATVTFMGFGVLTVFLVRAMGGH